ncbi:MAG: C_GCAxxG_C_C family protein [Asgard group archaeon]|nr:C_GCAxxG_C_C family protein [Asgard group archaeon]
MTSNKSIFVEEALQFFKERYNCAQSVLFTLQKFWKVDYPLEPKVVSIFGGGMGRRGSVCGALTGGITAIGLKYGTNKPISSEIERGYLLTLKFYNQFEEKCGGIMCRDLIGYDLTDEKEVKKARDLNVFIEKCAYFIQNAVEILIDLNEDLK